MASGLEKRLGSQAVLGFRYIVSIYQYGGSYSKSLCFDFPTYEMKIKFLSYGIIRLYRNNASVVLIPKTVHIPKMYGVLTVFWLLLLKKNVNKWSWHIPGLLLWSCMFLTGKDFFLGISDNVIPLSIHSKLPWFLPLFN